MITMLLGGLWHGASWTFVIWGALHGLFLCVERLGRDWQTNRRALQPERAADGQMMSRASVVAVGSLPRVWGQFGLAMLTFFLVNVTWVFFRAPTFKGAMLLLLAMFGIIPNGAVMLSGVAILTVAVVTVGLVGCHWFMRDRSVVQVAGRLPIWGLSLTWAALLIAVILTQKGSGSFIYFQF